jgi:hypothetical protein
VARRSGWNNAAYVTVQQAKRAGAEALNVLASPIFHARHLRAHGGLRLPAIRAPRSGQHRTKPSA